MKLAKEPSKKTKKNNEVGIAKKVSKIEVAFGVLMFVLMLILLVNRSFPYFLYGPFGFGYDMGIYKHAFEGILNFEDIGNSIVDIFPSFLAYLVNALHIPMSFLLYHAYILFSAFIAVPLYFLTKELFGKYAAILAIVIFTVSYVQVTASEFYLYKAVLGSIFMLFSFYFYAKKSYWFYLFAFLLAITQMPQILILGVSVAIAAIFGGKKDFKFNLISFIVLGLGLAMLLIFRSDYFFIAFKLVVSSFEGSAVPGNAESGFFMNLGAYLYRCYVPLALGILGFILSLKNRQVRALQVGVVFVGVVVFFRLFFENRYIVEFDLLLIPFTAYAIVYFFRSLLKKVYVKVIAGIVCVAISFGASYWYLITTLSALSVYEVWAIDVVNNLDDSEYVFVPDTLYAPWFYGYSNKTVLAPGIFKSVWGFEDWMAYHSGDDDAKVKMLLKLSKKYGKFYMFMGQADAKPALYEISDKIDREFEVNGAAIYEILP